MHSNIPGEMAWAPPGNWSWLIVMVVIVIVGKLDTIVLDSFSNVLASCLPFCRPGWQGRLRTTVVLFFCGMGQKHGRDATLWLETIAPDQGLLWWMSIESRNSTCSYLAALWQISLMLTGYWSLLSLISQADLIRICRGWNVHVLFLCREKPRIDFLTVQRAFGWLLERKFDWTRGCAR